MKHNCIYKTKDSTIFLNKSVSTICMVVKIESRSFSTASSIIVYTCKPHIMHKYSLLLTPRIFSSKMLYFG